MQTLLWCEWCCKMICSFPSRPLNILTTRMHGQTLPGLVSLCFWPRWNCEARLSGKWCQTLLPQGHPPRLLSLHKQGSWCCWPRLKSTFPFPLLPAGRQGDIPRGCRAAGTICPQLSSADTTPPDPPEPPSSHHRACRSRERSSKRGNP